MGNGILRNNLCQCGSKKKYKNCCLGKVMLNDEELKKQLFVQLKLLTLASRNYDNGDVEAAINIATCLRTLLHDGNTTSLFSKLRLKGNNFLSAVYVDARKNLMSTEALVNIRMGPGGMSYLPKLDNSPVEYKTRTFKEWWEEEVIICDGLKNMFVRKDLILLVADTDGGAHQDEELDRDYWELTRNGSIGWIVNGKPFKDSPCPASIRQIAYEVLKSLENLGIKGE